jgi:single-stranded DNA-binding protein
MQVSRDIMADRVEFVGGGKKNDNANGTQQQAQAPSYANSPSAESSFPSSNFQCGNQLNRTPQQPSAPSYQQQPLPFSPKDSDDDLPF